MGWLQNTWKGTLILKDKGVFGTMFIYCFADPNLGVEAFEVFFEKNGATE